MFATSSSLFFAKHDHFAMRSGISLNHNAILKREFLVGTVPPCLFRCGSTWPFFKVSVESQGTKTVLGIGNAILPKVKQCAQFAVAYKLALRMLFMVFLPSCSMIVRGLEPTVFALRTIKHHRRLVNCCQYSLCL
jgi:hypothetical protein